MKNLDDMAFEICRAIPQGSDFLDLYRSINKYAHDHRLSKDETKKLRTLVLNFCDFHLRSTTP